MVRTLSRKLDLSLLYAEDEAVTRSVMCEVLATKIRSIYQASNGMEGLEMYRQCRPDVVLVDNNMPGMDGISLARAILALDPAACIIVVSGDIKRDNLSQMEQMNLHYIKKPIRIRELLALLEGIHKGIALPPHLAAHPHASRR